MLVVISDLHLTDGTSGSTIHPGAFSIFAERLADMAGRAAGRSDGSYRPIEHIDLVLLGDILDIIRSNRWLEGTVRPWDDPTQPEFAAQVSSICDDILSQNQSALETLRMLSRGQGISLPPATHAGHPDYHATQQKVPVRIHYMVGNHDWMLHLPGAPYDAIRARVADAFGMPAPGNNIFPHDAHESPELLEVMRKHRVMARHGDIFDPLNFDQHRDGSSLGDVIVVELVNRFALEVERQMGEDLPVATLRGLRELDNIRPLLMIPVWIDGLLERTCSHGSMRHRVKRIWDDLVEQMLALPFVRERDTWSPVDVVDGLQRALRFSRRLSIGWASSVASWLATLRGQQGHSYMNHALQEQDFRNRRAQHIVYGHTHHAESLALDASYAEQYVLNQLYHNTGTWRRLYHPAQASPGEHEFIAAECMTYLSFFQGSERGGRPFESWSGMLGISTSERANYRVDVGSQHAAEKPISTPELHINAPNFLHVNSASRTEHRDA
jgi:UDP-2,3-diacylglucosamine pyrophosphatase LpxH